MKLLKSDFLLLFSQAAFCLTLPFLVFSSRAFANDAPCPAPIAYALLDESTISGPNLLADKQPGKYKDGFETLEDGTFFIDGADRGRPAGVCFSVQLNQKEPQTIFARGMSRCENVSQSATPDYSIYLDIVFTDGTCQYGVISNFPTRKPKDFWTKRTVAFQPEKPIKSLSMYFLFRNTPGKAWFKSPELYVSTPQDDALFQFDGLTTKRQKFETPTGERFYVRDAGADGPFYLAVPAADSGTNHNGKKSLEAAGVRIQRNGTKTVVANTTSGDRAITVIRAIPVPESAAFWYGTMDQSTPLSASASGTASSANKTIKRELSETSTTPAGMGRLGQWPLAGVGLADGSAVWLALDPDYPAVYRLFYNPSSQELGIAYDLGFTAAKSQWTLSDANFTTSAAESQFGFRSGWKQYMTRFPAAFACHLPRDSQGVQKMGVWMPFAAISKVNGWEDFGFRFKEGDGETAWDDEHDILTYRYTEPMTWWMALPKDEPATMENALKQVEILKGKKSSFALAWDASVMFDQDNQPVGRFMDTPWCVGIVWSMNSVPTIPGEYTHFKSEWPTSYVEQNYGTPAAGPDSPDFNKGRDGEYIDSSEGYVTAILDYRREHLDAADRPITFDRDAKQLAVFRGLVTYEYIRKLSQDVRKSGRSMMANSTPYQLFWLAPLLDILGTETNWNWNGNWRPMSHVDLIRKRALIGPKPYCFLQNTDFEKFPYEYSEKFMKRSLAYGMFPGYFSHNAAEGHYFTRPELYDRDRPLFKKYIPLCRTLAEAGWQPEPLAKIVSISPADESAKSGEETESGKPAAHSAYSSAGQTTVSLERFGEGDKIFVSLFNHTDKPQTVRFSLPPSYAPTALLIGPNWKTTPDDSVLELTLDAEDVAVIQFNKAKE